MAYSGQPTNRGPAAGKRETIQRMGDIMFKIPVYLLIFSVLIAGVVTAQVPDASIAKATTEYEEWMDVMVEFTRGVEIDEGDIQNFLEFWPEMDDLEVMNREDETDSAAEFATDVGEILAAPEYQAWARGNGLDPEGWLRKSMRVATLLIAQQMEAQREMMASQRESLHQDGGGELCPGR